MKNILILLFSIMSFAAMAQPLDGPGDPGDDPDAGAVPITGIEILFAAGGFLGAKKIYDNKKKSQK